MSMMPASRTTLADLIVLISQADLSGRRRRVSLGRANGCPAAGGRPAAIAADPLPCGADCSGRAGSPRMSRGRWANIRSLLSKALALARPMMPGRNRQAILPEWRL